MTQRSKHTSKAQSGPQVFQGELQVPSSFCDETRFLTQVVDSYMHLKAVCRLGVGTHHHSRIVDQNVEMFFLCREQETEP